MPCADGLEDKISLSTLIGGGTNTNTGVLNVLSGAGGVQGGGIIISAL